MNVWNHRHLDLELVLTVQQALTELLVPVSLLVLIVELVLSVQLASTELSVPVLSPVLSPVLIVEMTPV